MPMLTAKQRKYLKACAHKLKPVVAVGNRGLVDAVLAELDLALEHHELLKLRLLADDRQGREDMAQTAADATGAEVVGVIGHVAILYRPAKQAQIKLPHS